MLFKTKNESFLDLIKEFPENEKEIIIKAYYFMKEAHDKQLREDGALFYTHPEFVAKLLLLTGHYDYELISAALLHDVAEDTNYSIGDIKKEFGETIAFLVDAVTDYGKGDGNPFIKDKAERDKLSHKKLLSYSKKDKRVLLIKLADRIHNLSTMSSLSKERQKRILNETISFHKKIAQDINHELFLNLLNKLIIDKKKEFNKAN